MTTSSKNKQQRDRLKKAREGSNAEEGAEILDSLPEIDKGTEQQKVAVVVKKKKKK